MDVDAREAAVQEGVDGVTDGASGTGGAESSKKKKKKKKKSAKSMHDGSGSGAPSKHVLHTDEADPSPVPPKKRM